MTAALIPFETRAAREQRLYRECEAAYFAHLVVRTPASRAEMARTFQRWVGAWPRARQRDGERTCAGPDTAA
jgi:hypothetical protein